MVLGLVATFLFGVGNVSAFVPTRNGFATLSGNIVTDVFLVRNLTTDGVPSFGPALLTTGDRPALSLTWDGLTVATTRDRATNALTRSLRTDFPARTILTDLSARASGTFLTVWTLVTNLAARARRTLFLIAGFRSALPIVFRPTVL